MAELVLHFIMSTKHTPQNACCLRPRLGLMRARRGSWAEGRWQCRRVQLGDYTVCLTLPSSPLSSLLPSVQHVLHLMMLGWSQAWHCSKRPTERESLQEWAGVAADRHSCTHTQTQTHAEREQQPGALIVRTSDQELPFVLCQREILYDF